MSGRSSIRSRRAGFTFLEMAIAMAIFMVLLVSIFSITGETSRFIGDNDTESQVQMEGSHAFQRMLELLRKSGRVTEGGVTYPQVLNGGTELEFRVLADLDGNGYPFAQGDGGLEWHPSIFTIKRDAGSNLDVYLGPNKVYSLGRYIENLSFQTVVENPAIHFREIQINYEVHKRNQAGAELVYPIQGSVHMRH